MVTLVAEGCKEVKKSGILMCWMYMCLLWLWLL